MKFLLAILTAMFAVTAQAEYRMIVPDAPGSGGATWAAVVAKHLGRYTDEPIVLQHVPGARNIPGMNQWHKEFRFDNKTMVVSFGSHAVNFLLEPVDYNFNDYEAIAMENSDIIIGHNKSHDPKTQINKFGGGNALIDALGVALMICGPQPSTDAYLTCWRERMIWVNGVAGNQIRHMYLRGELNITRDPPASWLRFYEKEPNTSVWFTHGLRDLKTGSQVENPNYSGKRFEDVYRKTWGADPRGDLFETYHLGRTFNNVLQKVIWVNRGNPNANKLRDAVRRMQADPEAMAALEKESGRYEWIVGDRANQIRKDLNAMITEKRLVTLVRWYKEAYNTNSVYKPGLITNSK